MCPICITTVALVAAGAGSTGGLTAVVARTLRRKRAAPTAVAKPVRTSGSTASDSNANNNLRGDQIVARHSHDKGART